MKRLSSIILAACALFVANTAYSQNLQEEGLAVMKGIRQNTQADFIKDDFNIIAIVSIFIAAVSFIFSVKTYKEQKATKNNTSKLSQDTQKSLMNDMIRHLYRNYVITYAIRTKLQDINFNGYPSEEHLHKLKIPMENIHLEVFLGDEKKYKLMHNLYLNLRNYNEEIMVTLIHLKDKTIDIETKHRDLDVLEFKVSYLTRRIVDTENSIWGKQTKEGIMNSLDIALKDVSSAVGNISIEGCDCFDKISTDKINKTYYAELFDHNESLINEFASSLNNAVKVERMLNERGAEKIHIIKY